MAEKSQLSDADECFMLWVLIAQTRDAVSRARERGSLAASLFKVRSKVLQDLGIPEWRFTFPLNLYGAKE